MLTTAPRIALLIDAENIAAHYADAIIAETARLGDIIIRRLYGNVQDPALVHWLRLHNRLGLMPQHQPQTAQGKNASDIALVIDAMDLMHGNRVDGVVLVSSDSDFTRLAQRLREQGLAVYGMGEAKTPEAFRMACKQFFLVENLGDDAAPPAEKASLNHAYQLIANVMQKSCDEEGWIALGPLGHLLTQRYPDFDPRSYGVKRLSDLIKAIDKLQITGSGSAMRARMI